MKEYFRGIAHFFKAFEFIFKNGLAYYYIFPIIIAVIYYMFLFGFLFTYSVDLFTSILRPYIPKNISLPTNTPDWLTWLKEISLLGITGFLLGLAVLLFAFKFTKYFVLIIMSPIFSLLSEKVEEKLSGQIYPFDFVQFLKDIARGTIISLRNMLIETAWIIIFWFVGLFIGPFNLILTPVLFLISAYFFGFSMMDYSCERKRMGIREGIRYIRRNRLFAMGIGTMYALLDFVPIIGFTIGPVNALVGAGVGIEEKEMEKRTMGSNP
ncbi:MAG TPA: EI24 domain-containing protein [Bacteroidia bacterium]